MKKISSNKTRVYEIAGICSLTAVCSIIAFSFLQPSAKAQSTSPDPTPNAEATPCPGTPSETVSWNTHASFLGWKCDSSGLNFDSSSGSYVKNETDACGVSTSTPGSSHLEWSDVRTVQDTVGTHDEYKLVEVDSDGNEVGSTGWLTPICCGE